MLPYQTISQKENGIAIVGIGGAGANILQCFSGSSADHVRLCTLSLDERVGRACGSNVEFIQLGGGLNHGLGSGGDPEVGRQAAEESLEPIRELLKDARLLVLIAGLGGGTGSGAAPVLAQLARDAGLFLVSVVLMPFSFEGRRRRDQAEKALEDISRLSDIVYCFENDYMEELFRSRPGARAVFEEVDRLLAKAAASVPMLATSPGLINLGLDELAIALANNDSRCIFGSGSGYGPRRSETAAQAALESPLVSYHDAIRYARTVIVHIAGGDTMSVTEIRQAMETIREALADDNVNIFFGVTVKPRLGDEMRVTLIASIDAGEFKAMISAPPAEPARVQVRLDKESAIPEEASVEGQTRSDSGDDNAALAEEASALPEPDEGGRMEEPDDESEEATENEGEEEPCEPAPLPRKEETQENPAPSSPLRQGELLNAGAPAPSREDVATRLRNLFPEDEQEAQPVAVHPRPLRQDAPPPELEARIRSLFPEDDIDGEPAVALSSRPRMAPASPGPNVNDLRDIFRS